MTATRGLPLSVDPSERLLVRFIKKCDMPTDNGCWVWNKKSIDKKYPYTWHNSRPVSAHRLSYALFVDDIPGGKLIMHHCDNPRCVNPEHLSLGSDSDNRIDCERKGRRTYKLKTHCPRGHELNEINTFFYHRFPGGPRKYKGCKICRVARVIKWKKERKLRDESKNRDSLLHVFER